MPPFGYALLIVLPIGFVGATFPFTMGFSLLYAAIFLPLIGGILCFAGAVRLALRDIKQLWPAFCIAGIVALAVPYRYGFFSSFIGPIHTNWLLAVLTKLCPLFVGLCCISIMEKLSGKMPYVRQIGLCLISILFLVPLSLNTINYFRGSVISLRDMGPAYYFLIFLFRIFYVFGYFMIGLAVYRIRHLFNGEYWIVVSIILLACFFASTVHMPFEYNVLLHFGAFDFMIINPIVIFIAGLAVFRLSGIIQINQAPFDKNDGSVDESASETHQKAV